LIKIIEKYPILTIIIAVALMLLPFLGVMEVSIMEARNFITAREMLTDGNWILTTMNGDARYEKPPLPTWLAASMGGIFGVQNVWAMRFPGVVMLMLLGAMVFTLSRKLHLTKLHSFVNSLVAITSLYIVAIVFEAPSDIYAHALMFCGIYFIFSRLQSQDKKTAIYQWIFTALFISMSVLSKGPVSLYILLLPFIIAYIILFRKTTHIKNWIWISISILIGLIIGFSWYFYIRYVDYETFVQITSKETDNWTGYNVKPFYYYWSFFTQSGIWTIPAFISLLYPYMKSRVINLKAYQFTLLWTLIAVILLSIIPEKKSRYLMPVLIPLALNIGFYLEYIIRSFNTLRDKREQLPVYLNFGLIAISFLIISSIAVVLGYKTSYLTTVDIIPLFIIIALSAFLLIELKRRNIKTLVIGILGYFILSLNIVFNAYSKYLKTVTHNNNITLASNNKVISYPIEKLNTLADYQIYSLSENSIEITWEYGDKIPLIYKDSILKTPRDQKFYALTILKDSLNIDKMFPKAKTNYLFTIDINNVPTESRRHRSRKIASLFLVEQ